MLLLPKLCDIEYAMKIKKYIDNRNNQGQLRSPIDPIYDCKSFAFIFCKDSKVIAELKHQIEEEMLKRISNKKKELEKLQKEAIELNDILENYKDCTYDRLKNSNYRYNKFSTWFEDVHSPSCNKCFYSKELNNLSIVPYVKPLPEDPHLIYSILFEFKSPKEYRRDALSHFLFETLEREIYNNTTYQLP